MIALSIFMSFVVQYRQSDSILFHISGHDESIHPQLLINAATAKLETKLSRENERSIIRLKSDALERAGRYEEAIHGYKQLLETADDTEIKLALGFCYLKTDKPNEAKPLFENILNQGPSNLIAHIGLSRCALQSKQLVLAAKELEAAHTIDSENVLVVLSRAQMGMINKGAQRDVSIRQISDAISTWADGHSWQPFVLADLLKDRGKLYYYQGDYTKSITDLRIANSLGFDDHLKLVSQAYLIFCHVRLGNRDASRLLLEDLLTKFKKLPANHISYDFLRQFHYMELALSNNDSELLKQIAELINSNKPSIRDFNIAIQYYMYLGKFKNANYLCGEYGKRFEFRNPAVEMLHAYLLSSSPDDKDRDAQLAIKLTASYEEDFGNNPKFLMVRALAYAEAKQFDAAILLMEKAISKLPEKAPAKVFYQEKLDTFKASKPYRLNSESRDLDIIESQ